ncbi:LpxI family protein [Amorphus orientalis]|uniref:DUF1009 family protein n=1 Tax=Amorphus orientalis TaxID=649198 RepID=A0AAE4AU41_9HYPH|nr:UDP-2,3-diacylglucosamine diphosphatase LpxI [Amorphus orientalis]MDQ0315554.1 DUF1009 family protein [Amorphus orientalis]
MTDPAEPAGPGPVGIVAGGGRLPLEVAEAVEATGRKVVLACIDGEADLALDHPEAHVFRWGQVGGAVDFMTARGARDVVFVGTITRRPDFKAMRLDAGAWRRVPKILRVLVGGDDSVVRRALALVEEEGFRVRGIAEVAPGLLVKSGTLGRCEPEPDDLADAALGMKALGALGPYDVGQAAVVTRGRVVAIEAAEGTDRMLERVVELRKAGRVREQGGVLVKRSKPGQDLRTELPTIGASTIAGVAAARLSGVYLEAGRTLVADRKGTIAAADAARLFLVAGTDGEEGP